MRHFFLMIGFAIAIIISPATPIAADEVDDLIVLINEARAKSGRKQLILSSDLQQSAQKHADELVNRGYGTKMTSGGHTGRNGSSPRQRASRNGYKACYIVENVAWGQKTVQRVFNEWMASSKHKKNIMDRKTREIGIGFGGPKTWVMVGAKGC